MTERPTTPITPKIPKEPQTPPSERKRLSSFLTTPDQSLDHLPYSPSLKRTNEASKLTSHNVQSPYHLGQSALKTPRHGGYESDEDHKLKMQKTPTYFSPGRKLFEEPKEREELSEITSQLKGKLSTAIGKLQKQQKIKDSYKFNFTELNFNTETSPTKKMKSSLQKDLSKPQEQGQGPDLTKSNYHLQSLTQDTEPLKGSPFVEKLIDIPITDEDSSAHNALMATLSRQQQHQPKKPKSLRPLSLDSYKLPPLNLDKPQNFKFGAGSSSGGKKKDTEQDAVYSLMSLSSPQSNKFSHSRTQSLNNSPGSRTASVVLPLPSPIHTRSYSRDGAFREGNSPAKLPQLVPNSPGVSQLPPISGILGKNDDDATDIEDTDEDVN